MPKDITVRNAINIYLATCEHINSIFGDSVVANFMNQKVGTLSTGELRYLEISLVIKLGHPFVLLDEPFSMIEPLHKEALKATLIKAKEKKGIVMTDHYYQDVLHVADKLALMKDGRTIPIKNESDLVYHGYLSGKYQSK